jgi:protein TonB
VDPVSRILIEREGKGPRLAPFAIIALVMHLSMALAIFFAARGASSRPAHLPVVAVKFVQAQPKITRARPKTSSTETKEPLPKPTAPPQIQPTAIPTQKPVKAAPQEKAASENAMRSVDSTPPPTKKPRPAAAGTGAGSAPGVTLGGGDDNGGRGAPGIPSDFQFTYYINRMLSLIESHWYKPPVAPKTKAQVAFRVLKSGKIEAIRLEESSGVPTFDRAVLRAMYATNPLPPLPPAYQKPSLTIHLTFSE